LLVVLVVAAVQEQIIMAVAVAVLAVFVLTQILL
jgi:hypothetical protein